MPPRPFLAASLAAASGADTWAQLGTAWSQYVAAMADALLTVQTATHLPWWAAIAVRAPGSRRSRAEAHARGLAQGVTVAVRSVQLPFVAKSLRVSERCAASASLCTLHLHTDGRGWPAGRRRMVPDERRILQIGERYEAAKQFIVSRLPASLCAAMGAPYRV